MRKHNEDYEACVSDLTRHDDIKRLNGFTQHLNTSRLEHCVNVSYFSYLICKKLGWDHRSAARAGLLHDFYHYDWRTQTHTEERHTSAHPKAALENAKKITPLNEIEADAIINHMWPLTFSLPKYRESYVVNLMDTFCAAYEFAAKFFIFLNRSRPQPQGL
ncbi:MAG: HD domain-containing protein [Defluviitaleaceae bacterium]|nr:HD domain-containing protein [Defluviitaleaceae bacterium]